MRDCAVSRRGGQRRNVAGACRHAARIRAAHARTFRFVTFRLFVQLIFFFINQIAALANEAFGCKYC